MARLGKEVLFTPEPEAADALGLSQVEAQKRLQHFGRNELVAKRRRTLPAAVAVKLASPLNIMLLLIGFFSVFFGEPLSAVFVFLMVAVSLFLDTYQEFKSQ